MNKLSLFKRYEKFLLATCGVAILLLGACTSDVGTAPEELTPEAEAALVQRVTERWHAMEAKDFGKAYEFATPNYRRIFPKSLYVNKFSYAVDWELTGVDIVNYDARAAVASVVVRVMSKPTKLTSVASRALGAVPITIHERWFFVDGEWWHSAKQ